MGICELTIDETRVLEEKLDLFDTKHTAGTLQEMFKIGYKNEKNEVVGGLFATTTAYNIVYVSILFVEENYRRQGIGQLLMKTLEQQAKQLGTSIIRLDTFDWQGKDFYQALGYEEIGCYHHNQFNVSEHFFLKRL